MRFEEVSTGFVRTEYPISDVISYQVTTVFRTLVHDLQEIEPSRLSDTDIEHAYRDHRAKNLDVMRQLVRQAPLLHEQDTLAWDMDDLLKQVDQRSLRVREAIALASYVARSAVEAAHFTGDFYTQLPLCRFLCIENSLKKLNRPFAAEWQSRARDMLAGQPHLMGMQAYVHFVLDEATGKRVFRITRDAFRDAALRSSASE